jgi:hypothetical protein
MASLGHFDASTVAPAQVLNAIPAGEYPAMVIDSQMKITKDGTGQYLELVLEIQEGLFKGRRLWDRLNLQNRSSQTVEIAQRQLSALCHAIGVMQVNDSEQLHHKPCVVKVSVRPPEANREPTNEVKGYKALAAPLGQQPAFVAPVRQAAAPAHMLPPAAAPARSAAPWAK